MLSACATNGHRDLLLALPKIPRSHATQELFNTVNELCGTSLGHHIGGNVRRQTGLGTQLRDPIRVWQEADVKDEVSVDRDPTLKPEGHHLECQPFVNPLSKGMVDALG